MTVVRILPVVNSVGVPVWRLPPEWARVHPLKNAVFTFTTWNQTAPMTITTAWMAYQ